MDNHADNLALQKKWSKRYTKHPGIHNERVQFPVPRPTSLDDPGHISDLTRMENLAEWLTNMNPIDPLGELAFVTNNSLMTSSRSRSKPRDANKRPASAPPPTTAHKTKTSRTAKTTKVPVPKQAKVKPPPPSVEPPISRVHTQAPANSAASSVPPSPTPPGPVLNSILEEPTRKPSIQAPQPLPTQPVASSIPHSSPVPETIVMTASVQPEPISDSDKITCKCYPKIGENLDRACVYLWSGGKMKFNTLESVKSRSSTDMRSKDYFNCAKLNKNV